MNSQGALAAALLLGMVVPWATMRMLRPTLAESARASTTNYRGARVSYGLGVVWLIWGGCALVVGSVAALSSASGAMRFVGVAGLVAILAFAFGLIDDAYGSGDARGFRGHLGAMARGRLTTGGLKLLGIGSASLAASYYVSDAASWGQGAGRVWIGLIAAAAIALSANLLNLLDLRPGRALKAFTLLAALAWCLVVFVWVPPTSQGSPLIGSDRVLDAAALLVFLAGPVVAVWRDDLGEVGMLGDAGANPMGAVAATLAVVALPAWGVVAYAAIVLALNLTSERVSFSKVIDATPPLRWFDGLGRRPESS